MNILHISRTMGQGGAEKVVYQICTEKSDNNMFVASTGGILGDELQKQGITQIIIPDIDKKSLLSILKTFLILKRSLRKYKIDVIHSHHRMAAFYSRIICLFNKNIKRVYTAHNVFYDKKNLLRFSLYGSKIIAVGNGVKENLITYYKIKSNLIEVIYNSVEKPQNEKVAKDEIFNEKDKFFIGTIGRLSEQKGIDIFLKAMHEVLKNNKNVYGLIIGDGELKSEMLSLTELLKIKDNIYFLGYRKDVLELIKKLDFVVLASRWEGFPLTPIETFMMGKTIIASNIAGNNEIIKDNINGLLFEKDNYIELSKKINYLLDNNEIKKRLENSAKIEYLEKYNYDVFIEKYNNLYKKLEG